MKTIYKTILNGKELNANELLHNGDCDLGKTFECYQYKSFELFFSTDSVIEEHENEQVEWKTRETFLDKLEFYMDYEVSDNPYLAENRLQPSKKQAEMLLKVCQEKYYKIEEI